MEEAKQFSKYALGIYLFNPAIKPFGNISIKLPFLLSKFLARERYVNSISHQWF